MQEGSVRTKKIVKSNGSRGDPFLVNYGEDKIYGGGGGVIYFDFGHLYDVGTNYLQNLWVPSNK